MLIEYGGVDPDVARSLPCPDVHMMVATLARARYVASTDRRLMLDEYPPVQQRLTSLRWWQGYAWPLLLTLCALAAAGALWLICSPVWRTFT
jgi:hypothetical protein